MSAAAYGAVCMSIVSWGEPLLGLSDCHNVLLTKSTSGRPVGSRRGRHVTTLSMSHSLGSNHFF